ncbi:hypothetical protein CCR75_004134 [Bremia lactucae]|uniref:Ankyrin repeat protein n=1 Tax=Bremia lactucae TaxID=4779 RepID=A0A976ICH6_BRELC|nr:hypothetical protein CCR75_004134 [Bremia lactucae]
MKRSFQHVYALTDTTNDNACTTQDFVTTTAVGNTALNTNPLTRPRKYRVLCRTTLSKTLTTASSPVVLTPYSPSCRGNLEEAIHEEALLYLVLSYLNVCEHQVIQHTSRSWRRRVRTMDLNRLDLSVSILPICARSLGRVCRGVFMNYSRVCRLDLTGQRSIVDRDLLVLTSYFWAHIQEIIVDDCVEISDFGLLALLNAQSCQLRAVSVRRCKRIAGELFASHAQQLTGIHPLLTRLHLDDTSVTCAFLDRIETQFPTLECLSALHTPAHRAFFQQDSILNSLLVSMQHFVTQEGMDSTLSVLLNDLKQWCSRRRGKALRPFERTLIASGMRMLLDVPLLFTGSYEFIDTSTGEQLLEDVVFLSPMLFACASGNTRLVGVLLTAGCHGSALDLENTDLEGHTALSVAVANGLVEATRLLLIAGSNVNSRSLSLASPLYRASEHGWDVLVDMLLDAKADCNCATSDGTIALCGAAKNGHRSTVLRLLAAEKHVKNDNTARRETFWPHVVQALFLACEGGHLFVVSDLLLLTELDANVLMNKNVSPLYLACQMGYVSIVSLLLDRGADPTFHRPQGGVTCLYIAAQEGHDQIVRMLIRAGAPVSTKMEDKSTALHIAARMGRKGVTRVLLRAGAFLNDQTRSGLTALYIASEEGHLELVRYLLEIGAARDIQAASGATALFAAVFRGHRLVVEALLMNGASATISKHHGASPLDAAILLGHDKIARLLLRFGARAKEHAMQFAERRREAAVWQSRPRLSYCTQHTMPKVAASETTGLPTSSVTSVATRALGLT